MGSIPMPCKESYSSKENEYKAKRICKAERKRKNTKPVPKNPHQSCYPQNSLALLATDSLDLQLAYLAIKEHIITQQKIIIKIKMVFLKPERLTFT